MLTASDIKSLRVDLDESQLVFGRRFNVTQTAVWRWENGNPPRRGLVAQALVKLRNKTPTRVAA